MTSKLAMWGYTMDYFNAKLIVGGSIYNPLDPPLRSSEYDHTDIVSLKQRGIQKRAKLA